MGGFKDLMQHAICYQVSVISLVLQNNLTECDPCRYVPYGALTEVSGSKFSGLAYEDAHPLVP